MAISVLNAAPTAVVLVVSGVCIWPYLWGPGEDSDGRTASTPPELSAALLEPTVGTKFERNPFQDMAAVRLDLARLAFNRIKDKLVATLTKRGSTGEDVKPEPVGNDAPDLLARVVLNATYLHPDRRLAMINGRVYAPGETLKDLPTEGRYVLAEVRPHSVVITVRGKPQELFYPGLAAPTRDLTAKGPRVVAANRDGIEKAAPRRPPQRKASTTAAGAGPRLTQGRGR